MARTPKHIKEIAAMLDADENGPQWDALMEWKSMPSDTTALAMFEAILLRGAELHQRKVLAHA